MSSNPVKFTIKNWHSWKEAENIPHNENKSQSVATDAKINRDIKTAIMNILHMFKKQRKERA